MAGVALVPAVAWAGAFLLVSMAAAHSYLGERYILIRLFRRENLPKIFGSEDFTKRVLRFAWHVTSILWVGFAGVLVALSLPDGRVNGLEIVAATFALSAAYVALASGGRHLSWVVMLAVAALAWSVP